MRKYLIVGVAALAIAACSDKGADADGDGKISGEEAKAEMADGGAMATKPGVWEVKTSFSDITVEGVPEAVAAQLKAQMAKGVTVSSCLTKEQVEKPGTDFFGGPPEANCTFEKIDRSGNTTMVEMTCKPAGGMTLKSKMNGSFAAESYKMDVTQTIEGGPVGNLKMKGVAEGKRVGDCPA